MWSLVDKSLVVVEVDRERPRYRLPEPFRAFAKERLTAAGECDATMERHALAYFRLAKDFDRSYETTGDRECYGMATGEVENFRTCIEWLHADAARRRSAQELSGVIVPLVITIGNAEGPGRLRSMQSTSTMTRATASKHNTGTRGLALLWLTAKPKPPNR